MWLLLVKKQKNIKKIIFLLAYNSLLTDLEYIHTNDFYIYLVNIFYYFSVNAMHT